VSGGAGAGGAAGGTMSGGAGAGGAAGAGGGPPVTLPAGVTDLFPLPGAKQVCADVPLRLTFASAPQLGTSGKLRVFDATSSAQPVAEVDFATMSISDTYGGQTFSLPRQVYVDGNDVVVLLKNKALGYGKQYYVTVESGAIKPGGAAFSITEAMAWRFSTLASAATGSQLKVALDGSGQYCSWQGALDAVPSNNTAPVTISIGNGNYHGIVYVSGKQNITLSGQDRKKTVFSGTNNNNLNPSTKTRALIGGDNTSGLVVQNVTIKNLTPQGGSQAEALRLQGCDKCKVLSSDIVSLQDTLLWSGRIYAKDCYIAGNVDFVWGTGAAYFDQCEIKTIGRSGYIVQSRNGAGGYGYVFVDSKITADAGITGSTLARIDVSEYPDSHVAYIGCTLGNHISKAGWTVTGGSASSGLRFWEYQSKDANGNAVDVSGRAGGVQATAQQAAQMRDPSVVLGGWKP
jgi:pectin methylesterase-like acyl-CoA thioesterase